MAVLLADRLLGVRARVTATDTHGYRSTPSWGPLGAALPGRAEQRPDAAIGATGGRTWVLALDPSLWPVGQQDLVVDPDADQWWLVTSADLIKNNADPAIDYIRVEAHTRATVGTTP